MLRNIGAAVAGLVAGMSVNMALIMLNSDEWLHRDPADGGILGGPGSHLGQSFGGGWVAASLSASHPMRFALIIGVLSLVGGILNMMSIRGPTWMMIEVPLYIAVAWGAGRLEERRRAASNA